MLIDVLIVECFVEILLILFNSILMHYFFSAVAVLIKVQWTFRKNCYFYLISAQQKNSFLNIFKKNLNFRSQKSFNTNTQECLFHISTLVINVAHLCHTHKGRYFFIFSPQEILKKKQMKKISTLASFAYFEKNFCYS